MFSNRNLYCIEIEKNWEKVIVFYIRIIQSAFDTIIDDINRRRI
jgi:hypothetical protein